MASSSVSLSLCRCGWLMTGRVSDKLAASNLPPYHKKLTADSVAERIFLAYFKQALSLSLSFSFELSTQPKLSNEHLILDMPSYIRCVHPSVGPQWP